MIVTRGLTKRYGETLAVDNLSFTVSSGVVTGFLGPNGSGKSTTMRMILGLDRPDAGSALVNGCAYDELSWPLREVGALLDAKAFHPGRSARNHLRWLAQANDIPPGRVDTVLDLVGLTAVADRRAGKFSLGMDSGSASPVPCWEIPACCSWTSRSTASTRRASAGSATCCVTWRRKAGRCWSRAT
jgi:ABC-2 type transport system ATP-binding protein